MSKSVPFVGMVVSGIVGILFLADLAVAIPFSRVSVLADGRIVQTGGPELALQLEEEGYDALTQRALADA